MRSANAQERISNQPEPIEMTKNLFGDALKCNLLLVTALSGTTGNLFAGNRRPVQVAQIRAPKVAQ